MEKAWNGRSRTAAMSASASQCNAAIVKGRDKHRQRSDFVQSYSSRPNSSKNSEHKRENPDGSTTVPAQPQLQVLVALSQSHSTLSQQQSFSPTSNIIPSIKAMEVTLGVVRERAVPDPIERLLHARDLINSEKDRITESLVESMDRQDVERKVMSLRKLEAFEMGKVWNSASWPLYLSHRLTPFEWLER